MEGLLFLGINLPFARNLLQYVEEKRVLFIAYSNFQKEQIKFESSDRKFQIIPRDKMVLDTLSAYFEDFLDWKEELFRRKGSPGFAMIRQSYIPLCIRFQPSID